MKIKQLRGFILILLLLAPAVAQADTQMSNYCSAPPYVTRANAPNLMILMDNSLDMYNPAYPGAYDATTLGTTNHYIGYFNPEGCYAYGGGNTFVEVLKTVVGQAGGANFGKSYTASDTCPSGTGTDAWGQPANAPFRGNLLNWATMSKFDVVEQLLVGGNATSKQPGKNFYTLKGIEGDWTASPGPRIYNGCVFVTNNGNLTISDDPSVGPGACTLLATPATPIAWWRFDWLSGLFSRLWQGVQEIYAYAASGIKSITASAASALEAVTTFVQNAWASTCTVSTSSSLNGTVDIPYGIQFSATGDNSATYTWTASISSSSSWENISTSTSSSGQGNRTNDVFNWYGTPLAAGTYTLTVSVSSSKGCTASVTKTITVTAATLQIVTTSLVSGNVGVAYSFAMTGQGGTTPWRWSASGLPSGLAICEGPSDATWNASTSLCVVGGNSYGSGVIYGTPTESGSFSVAIALSDNGGQWTSKTYSLTINTSNLTINTTSIPAATEGLSYNYTLSGQGGSGSYTWSAEYCSGSSCTPSTSGIPGGLLLNSSTGAITGTPLLGSAGTYTVLISLRDSFSTVTKTFTFTINVAGGTLAITSSCPHPDAVKGTFYSYQMNATGGSGNYTWSAMWCSGSGCTPTTTGLPSWLNLDSNTGLLSGTAPNQTETDTITFTVSDSLAGGTATLGPCTLNVVRSLQLRSQSFNIWVQLNEEPLTDVNGNNIFDPTVPGECFYDYVDNPSPTCGTTGIWQGKQGIFQQFWDQVHPRARWGLTTFSEQGAKSIVNINACIPASPAASFFTAIQNATPVNTSPLAAGLYGNINYFAFSTTNFASYDANSYKGCANSDPIDDVPCRKNFVLVLSSGTNVSSATNGGTSGGPFAGGLAGCSSSTDLVQDACVGYSANLRLDKDPTKVDVYTYIVNTMGSTNNAILQEAALAGHGKYYDSSNFANLRSQIIQAIQDILAQAASGTAVSVLTTSSRGVGSVVQAYFLPIRQDGTRSIWWTGYMQNIWIDPQSNLREDTVHDYDLILSQDDIIRPYFNISANETEVSLFTTDNGGNGGGNATCTPYTFPDTGLTYKPFSQLMGLWEAGQKLALTLPSDRNIFTSTKVLRGSTTVEDFSSLFSTSHLDNFDPSLPSTVWADALNPDTVYTADKIVRYVRGECVETIGVIGNTPCGSTLDPNFRDRRLTVYSSPTSSVVVSGANGNVWKLGDVISSTPKVLANTPQNVYNTRYSDATYQAFVTSTAVKQRPSVAFVGANDGMLHAFRVGYLLDSGLGTDNSTPPNPIIALFKNAYNDPSGNTAPAVGGSSDHLGQEMWGYIPFNAFPYLKYLADPGYCHIYFNDLSVKLVDASTDGNPTDTKPANGSSWRTILIGGMRFGGSCSSAGAVPNGPPISAATGTQMNVGYSAYYAIDVTDPTQPQPLWEFSDPDLGYTTSLPTVIRTGNKDENGNWYVTFGSGSTTLPMSGVDVNRSTPGYLYILNLTTGAMVQKISLTDNALVGDVLDVDWGDYYNGGQLYFGTAYYSSGWNGKLMGLTIPNQDLTTWTPASTALVTLFSGPYPFTASPDAVLDDKGNKWVYIGSGKYYGDVDETDTSPQIFLGLIDKGSQVAEGAAAATCPSTCPATSLCDTTACTTTGTVTGTDQICTYNPTLNKFDFETIVTSVAASGTTPAAQVGWKIYLSTSPSAERVISRPLAVGGIVDFLTYVPSSNACSYGGRSNLYAVGYTSGIAPYTLAIRGVGSTTATTGSTTVKRSVDLGPGAPPSGEAIILAPPQEGQDQLKKKIQVSTGVIVDITNQPVISTPSKVMQWLKQ